MHAALTMSVPQTPIQMSSRGDPFAHYDFLPFYKTTPEATQTSVRPISMDCFSCPVSICSGISPVTVCGGGIDRESEKERVHTFTTTAHYTSVLVGLLHVCGIMYVESGDPTQTDTDTHADWTSSGSPLGLYSMGVSSPLSGPLGLLWAYTPWELPSLWLSVNPQALTPLSPLCCQYITCWCFSVGVNSLQHSASNMKPRKAEGDWKLHHISMLSRV